MTTAGARLVFLAGPGTAGALLAAIGAGTTASSRLAARSGLGVATAAVHLMYDPGVDPPAAAGRVRSPMVKLGRMM